jgi:hypothetical protein
VSKKKKGACALPADRHQTFAVFLAYYLSQGTFGDASPLGYAFVGGLSISIGELSS